MNQHVHKVGHWTLSSTTSIHISQPISLRLTLINIMLPPTSEWYLCGSEFGTRGATPRILFRITFHFDTISRTDLDQASFTYVPEVKQDEACDRV